MGPQAHHRPVELQQGLFLREGLLPVLRHRAWRQAEAGHGRRRPTMTCRRCRSRACRRSRQTYDIIVTGVGGTGIVTIGGILGMAAHLEGKGVGVIDMAGLAQKGGAVYSHMRIAERPEDIHAIRDRGRRRRSRARRRHRGGRQQEGARRGQARRDRDGRQHSPSSCPAISPATPISRCRPSGSSAPSSPTPAASKTHFIDATRAATALFGNVDRRQHVPRRLCLSARRAAAVGGVDRARDRAQRRSGRDEQGGLPLGPSRRRSIRPRSRR